MQIDAKLNRRLHATALKAGINHSQLKEYCAQRSVMFDFLTVEQVIKLIKWMEAGIKAGKIYQNGKWVAGNAGNLNQKGCGHSPHRGITPADQQQPPPADEYEWRAMKEAEEQQNRVMESASELGQKYDNRRLAMTKNVSIVLHKKAAEKGCSHQDVLNIAQREFGTYFNRLSDAQGWYLYYLFEGNLSMMEKWKEVIKEQESNSVD